MKGGGKSERIKYILIVLGVLILVGVLIRSLVSWPEKPVPSTTVTPGEKPSVISSATPSETPGGTINPLLVFTVEPGESIQDVLDKMPGGGICKIKPGIYSESLVIPRSDLTLVKDGEGEVIIDGKEAVNAVLIKDVSNTKLQGLTIRNSAASLIEIDGSEASHNTIRQCSLLEWGLDDISTYVGAVDSANGASYTTVDLCYIDRGNHEAMWTQNPEAISFHFSGGHHTITNNIIWGVCRDDEGNPVEAQSDFGDGYPLYKFNIMDVMCGEDGKDRLDFDGLLVSGNHIYGAHDDMIGVQGLGRNCIIKNNYVDAMGGGVCVVLRGTSIGPVYVQDNIFVNSGIDCFKYASWSQGAGTALKYITGNVYYSTLSRGYTQTPSTWYIPIIDQAYNRFIDGEVNEANYDNLKVLDNYVLCRTYFLCLMPGSGTNNLFTGNHFSTASDRYCVKWYSDRTAISFSAFNSITTGDNVWEVINRPEEPQSPRAGAG